MKKPIIAILILLGSLLAPFAASAAEIRAFLTDFSVTPPESAQLNTTLKRLLASRLSGDGISTVDTPSEADVIISGSFTQLGKFFSLDAVAKSTAGKSLATAFEQGESLDSLIPAVTKVSAKLKGDLVKGYTRSPDAARPPEAKAAASEIVLPAKAAASEIVLPAMAAASEIVHQAKAGHWTSQRLAGALNCLATLGPNQFLIAENHAIHLYRQETTLALVATAKLPSQQKIVAIDSLGPDKTGKALLYVTIMDRDSPASKIYAVENNTLKPVAEDLPYLFRAISLSGGPKRLYAQQMGRTDDYYGDVHEATYAEGSVKLLSPIKMPRFANIFNFNTFRDKSGKTFITAFSDGGYLLVYSDTGEEIWRSNDRFGGSETSFQRRDPENERVMGTPFRTRFIDQRINVTDQGEIIVPQNGGMFVFGNSRSYSKYSVFSFVWNGSSLEERWRTRQSQNYLADYLYDPASKELVVLEVVQKEGMFGKGGSALKLIRAE